MVEATLIIIAAFLGAMTQRAIGFGIALFLPPILLLYYTPVSAIFITLICGTITSLLLLYRFRKKLLINTQVIIKLTLFALPGILIGSVILKFIDKSVLQILIGLLIFVAVYVQERYLPKPNRDLKVTKGVGLAGFIAGIFNATAGLAAPAILVWMRTCNVSPDQIRQNLSAIFILLNSVSLLIISVTHVSVFCTNTGQLIAIVLPTLILGYGLGAYFANKMNVKTYEKAAVLLILIAATVSITSGLKSLV